jgi:hypothetical protein
MFTHAQSGLMRRYLDAPCIGMAYEQFGMGECMGDDWKQQEGKESPYTLHVLRKGYNGDGGGAHQTPDLEEVSEYHRQVRTIWFSSEQPFLTPERERALRQAYRRKRGKTRKGAGKVEEESGDGGRVSVYEAYQMMFTPEEQEEISLELYMTDVDAFALEHEGEMSLAEMISFLQVNQ